jgi:hypothetical protein
MAKKQLQNQLRKVKAKEHMDKKREGKVPDRFIMALDPNNSRSQSKSYSMYDDFGSVQE